jgi:mRNA interferase RelE/StbE
VASRSEHPGVPGCLVRLTDAAIDDLRSLHTKDPSIVRWCLKKLIVIERDPNAGEALLGGLIGYRKITVGDRDWRIVWKVTDDKVGGYVVDVAEVWAVGYRKDSDVYDEIRARISDVGASSTTKTLVDVLALFEKRARGLDTTAEPEEPGPTPQWLVDSLVRVAGIPGPDVATMTFAEARQAWEQFTTSPKQQ